MQRMKQMQKRMKIITLLAGWSVCSAWATLPLSFTAKPTYPAVIQLNQTQSYSYTVQNNSPVALPITASVSVQGGVGSIVVDDTANGCFASSLSAGATCTFQVKYTASNTPGVVKGRLRLHYQGRQALVDNQLQFSIPGVIAFTPQAVNTKQGLLGAGATLSLRNTNTSTLTDVSITIPSAISGAITAASCSSIAPGGECVITMTGQGATQANDFVITATGKIGEQSFDTRLGVHAPLQTGGQVRCWGWNVYGQLGDGSNADSSTPVAVNGLTDVVALTGGLYHTCALLASGVVSCWGYNYYGQLGDGSTTDRTTPVAVNGLTDVVALTAGSRHTCALLASGQVHCWGRNNYGQLGDGSTTQRSTPVAVNGLTDVVALTAGGYHTCALLASGGVSCWGYNYYGQLGDGRDTTSSTPVAVNGLTDVVGLTGGFYHTCALLASGELLCWGYNGYGQLGNNTWSDSSKPVAVVEKDQDGMVIGNLTNVVALTAGGYHTCALLASGGVRCWGRNYYGQLGNDSTTQSSTPVAVNELTDVVALTAGDHHTCALLASGEVRCWGYNYYGQLGDGTTTKSSTPVPVWNVGSSSNENLLTDVVALTAGGEHTCAIVPSPT